MTLLERVEAVFREELSLEPPARDTDLIAAGVLDSLEIVGLLARLEERFDVTISLDTLDLEAIRTTRRLTALLEARAGAPGERSVGPSEASLVVVRHGVGPPVFLFHDSFALAETVRPLAAVLDTPRPIVALQAHGLAPGEDPDPTVEAMAARYVEAIRSVQPQGPYALAGFSFGGLVAYEVACRLQRAGAAIELLALVDTQVSPQALPPLRGLGFQAVRPVRYARYILAAPRTRGPLYWSLLRLRLRPGSVAAPPPAWSVAPTVARLKLLADRAEAAYRPPRYPGTAVLFRPADALPASAGRSWFGESGSAADSRSWRSPVNTRTCSSSISPMWGPSSAGAFAEIASVCPYQTVSLRNTCR